MIMGWQILTAISVITLSISVLLQRVILRNTKTDPIAYVVVFNGIVGIIIALYTAIHGFQLPDFSKFWLPILLTVLLFSVGHVVYAKALQQVEASIFTILFATNAIWVMMLGFLFFHELLTIQQLIGVLLIFASVGFLAERKGSLKLDKGIGLGLLTGLLFGLATFTWVYVGKHSDAASWTALSFSAVPFVVLLIHPKSGAKLKEFFEKSILIKMVLLGIVYSISAVSILTAFQYGQVSIIAPLQQSTIILTPLLAVIFLHERTRLWQKTIAAIVCFSAVLLIV